MLTLLARLGAAPAIEAFVVRATADGDYGRGDNEALLTALACLPPERQSALLALIVEKCAADAFGPCAALLASAVGRLPDISAAAKRLSRRCRAIRQRWRRDWHGAAVRWNRGMSPICCVRWWRPTERWPHRAAAHILAWPKTYDLDRVLVPALRGDETRRCCDRAVARGMSRPSARPCGRASGASGGLAACEPGVLQVRTLHGVEQISR